MCLFLSHLALYHSILYSFREAQMLQGTTDPMGPRPGDQGSTQSDGL